MNQPPPLLPGNGAGSSLLARILFVVTGLGLLALGIAFSLAFFAIALVVVGVVVVRVLWKTRHLRRRMREQASQAGDPMSVSPRGRTIEGEVLRADDTPPQP